MDEASAASAGQGGEGVGGGGEAPSSTKAALDDLLDVLGDDGAEAEGSWEEGAAEEEEEEEGVYLVEDDALADDADWKKKVSTGWEDGDEEEGEDEGEGVSWVDKCKVMSVCLSVSLSLCLRARMKVKGSRGWISAR